MMLSKVVCVKVLQRVSSAVAKSTFSTKVENNATSSVYRKYLAMAKLCSGGKIRSKDALNELAFNLQKLEDEKETEKAVAVVSIKNEKDTENLRAFYMKKLSFVSQRYVLETFFNHVLDLYRLPNSPLKTEIAKTRFGKDMEEEVKRHRQPKMSLVNKVLRINSVWSVVVREFSLGDDTIYPDFQGTLLYGVLSEGMHNPDLTKVIVSDLSESNYKTFFRRAAQFCDLGFTEFKEEYSESDSENL